MNLPLASMAGIVAGGGGCVVGGSVGTGTVVGTVLSTGPAIVVGGVPVWIFCQ